MLYQKTQSISEDLGERQGRIESVKRGGSLVPWLPPWGGAPPRGGAPWGQQVVLWRSHQRSELGSSPTRSQPHCGAAESRGKAMPLSF